VKRWKIKDVIKEANRLTLDVQDVAKLQDEEVSRRVLISMLKDGTLQTIISSAAAESLESITQLTGIFHALHSFIN
jgi:phosphotransferase system IIB component